MTREVFNSPADVLQFIRPIVRSVLENWANHRWSLQGFGMLRTYLSDMMIRLHVWDSKFAVPNVTTIHDHPWNFESHVVAGRITNTRYRARPCLHTEEDIVRQNLRPPFVKARIVCGPGAGNDPVDVKARGERVWLLSTEPETYEAGCVYRQEAHEIHRTSYEDGTVTLVSRRFLPDTEHANVYFRADESWVSAEPRDATPDEVSAIIERALLGFR